MFKIEDRGKGWIVYVTIPAEDGDSGEREMRAFNGHDDQGGRVPFNPFNTQHCHRALIRCTHWVQNHE